MRHLQPGKPFLNLLCKKSAADPHLYIVVLLFYSFSVEVLYSADFSALLVHGAYAVKTVVPEQVALKHRVFDEELAFHDLIKVGET